jgi:hypothetical protein
MVDGDRSLAFGMAAEHDVYEFNDIHRWRVDKAPPAQSHIFKICQFGPAAEFTESGPGRAPRLAHER